MIIIGRSESMVSECLFAGRSVHYGYGYGPEVTKNIYGAKLTRSGKVKYFPNKGALRSARFPSIDSTDMIVGNIVSLYKAHQLAESRDPWPELEAVKLTVRSALPAAMLG